MEKIGFEEALVAVELFALESFGCLSFVEEERSLEEESVKVQPVAIAEVVADIDSFHFACAYCYLYLVDFDERVYFVYALVEGVYCSDSCEDGVVDPEKAVDSCFLDH